MVVQKCNFEIEIMERFLFVMADKPMIGPWGWGTEIIWRTWSTVERREVEGLSIWNIGRIIYMDFEISRSYKRRN